MSVYRLFQFSLNSAGACQSEIHILPEKYFWFMCMKFGPICSLMRFRTSFPFSLSVLCYFHFLSTPSQPRRVRMTQRLITPIIHCFTFFLIPSLLHLPFSLFALLIIPFSLFHSFKKTKSFSLCLFCEKKEGGRWGSSNRDIRFRRIYQS